MSTRPSPATPLMKAKITRALLLAGLVTGAAAVVMTLFKSNTQATPDKNDTLEVDADRLSEEMKETLSEELDGML